MDRIELIDRVELMEKLRIVLPCSSCWENKEPCIGLCYSVKMAVMLTPAIDAAPVRRGEWVFNFETSAGVVDEKCSVCRSWFERPSLRSQYNFCPNCGADMRKEEHHEPEN